MGPVSAEQVGGLRVRELLDANVEPTVFLAGGQPRFGRAWRAILPSIIP